MKAAAFIFDDVSVAPDRQIGYHSHPQWELSHVICGAGSRTIGDLTEPMREGEIILIPPNIPHVWRFTPDHTDTDGNIANISVLFDTSLLEGLSVVFPETEEAVNNLKSLSGAINLRGEVYNKVYNLLMDMRGLVPYARVPKIIEILLTIATADNYAFAGSNNTLKRAERRLEKVRAFCNCNYARGVSLDEMALHVGMNKSAFCTFMRRYTGKTLSEFVNDIRLQRAMDMLLNTERNIAEIAFDAGFSNASYFNRLFRNKYKRTPTSVRAEKQL